MSHTLLILKTYTTSKDVQMMLKQFFDISAGFRFSKLQWGSVPSIPVVILDQFHNFSKKQSTIYSATTFLEKCGKVVLQTWIFFSGQPLFSNHKKGWIYTIKSPFFLVNHFSQTTFLKPDFSNHISWTRFLQTAKIEVTE